jgi:hypothetical protein
MAESFDIRPRRKHAPGDRYMVEDGNYDGEPTPTHPMDSEEAHSTLRRLLEWMYLERDRQAENRLEQSLDADFYDGMQWDPEDAELLRSRGQLPLVYNELAPMIDWLIGTERRTRVDWKVLPRTEDDVEAADIKTKVMKYVSDINRVPFTRSKAFADAIKVGVGWVDDGARDDPTQDILYSRYEDWRNVLWDSQSYDLDLSDARYLFRWRWVDEDIALMMFPERAAEIKAATEDQGAAWWDSEEDNGWYMGERLEQTGKLMAGGTNSAFMINTRRRRVKLIECQYRMPAQSKIVADGPFKGAFMPENDPLLAHHVEATGSDVVDKIAMRVHIAVFTESAMLSMGPSPYRHNKFSLTPIWCYRRSRDRLPYGAIRRVRDIQQDLNKRASKALFMLNTNQVIADEGAVADPNKARDEVDRPDGWIEKRAGKEFIIRRDTDAATGQIQMMTLAAQSIQKSSGVNNENLGRATNAVSGAAIEARQQQGAVGTTEPFDNLRLAVQIQGEKQLSMAEQFYSAPRVVRLTEDKKGALNWVRVNQPEVDEQTGAVRHINDITARMADFVVAEADYAGTMRQVMFDSLNQIVQKMPPEVGLRLFTIAMEFSDLPNKDLVADAIRAITGERDESRPMTPEEEQQAAQQQQQQAEAMEMQRQAAMATLEEQRAKVRELNAKAAEIEARVSSSAEPELMKIRAQAADQIDALTAQLAKANAELANRARQIGTDLEKTRIDADAKVRIAEIQAESDKRIAEMDAKLSEIETRASPEVEPTKAGETEKQAPAPAPVVNLTVQVDAKGEVKKSITVQRDAEGNITGASIDESEQDA